MVEPHLPEKRRGFFPGKESPAEMLVRIEHHLAIVSKKRSEVEASQSKEISPGQVQPAPKMDRFSRNLLLRSNLLSLTEAVAPLYDSATYGAGVPPVTRLYMKYEDEVLKAQVQKVRDAEKLDLAIDLGCATGRVALSLARDFWKVCCCDISPAMIRVAEENVRKDEVAAKKLEQHLFELETADVEDPNSWIYPNGYASLMVMNLGTASDIVNLHLVLNRIAKSLQRDGRFMLSFYNAGALFYRWFLPWPLGLVAEINQHEHCLDVHAGGKVYQVHARPYTIREVKNMIRGSGLEVDNITTYPTVASILPEDFLKDEEIVRSVELMDRSLAHLGQGAYIIVTGHKPNLLTKEERVVSI